VQCMARGTTWGCLALSSVSKKQFPVTIKRMHIGCWAPVLSCAVIGKPVKFARVSLGLRKKSQKVFSRVTLYPSGKDTDFNLDPSPCVPLPPALSSALVAIPTSGGGAVVCSASHPLSLDETW
jgi:hypothetical protein